MNEPVDGYRHASLLYASEGSLSNFPQEFIQLQDVLNTHLGSVLLIDNSGLSASPLEGFFHVSCRKYCSC
jgi:hypothetical protein